MNQAQSIPCPVCSTAIPFEVMRLLQGERFVCPKCDAAISLTSESRPQVQDTMDKLNKLKQGND